MKVATPRCHRPQATQRIPPAGCGYEEVVFLVGLRPLPTDHSTSL